MRRGEKKLTLEQYLQFYEEPWRFNLSLVHLNQIICMHGFVKLHNQSKSRLLECLESIELMPPGRPTLEQSISSCSFLTAEEIVEDLEALGWQECSVRSIQTLKSEAEQDSFLANADLPFISASSTSANPLTRRRRSSSIPPPTFVISGRRPRSKRKRVSINALSAATTAVSSSSTADVTPLLTSQPPTPPPTSSPPPLPSSSPPLPSSSPPMPSSPPPPPPSSPPPTDPLF